MGRHGALREHDQRGLAQGSPLWHLPEWLWQRLPELQELAAAFVVRCAEELAQSDAEIIGFSCMFQTLPSIAAAKGLKALAPEKVIVFGGTHCEGDMGLALHQAYPFIDFVGCGEGERLLVDLVSSLSGHGPELSAIQGLVRRESGRSLGDGANASRIADLDALPRTRYDDWFEQLRRVAPTLTAQDLELPIEASRGCWYGQKHHCTFCGLNGESLTFCSKSAALVYDDIQALNHLPRQESPAEPRDRSAPRGRSAAVRRAQRG